MCSLTAKPNPQSTRPSKWAVILAASIVQALHSSAVYTVPVTIISPMRRSLDLTVEQITSTIGAYRLVQAIFLIPSGFALDAVGAQISLRVSVTSAAFLAPLLALITSFSQLLLLQILFSTTKLIGGLSAMLIILNGVCANGGGMGIATTILLGGYSLTGLTMPAIVGVLDRYYGWRIATLVPQLFFSLISVPLTFYFLHDPRPTMRQPGRLAGLWMALRRNLRWLPWFPRTQIESEPIIPTPYLPLESTRAAASGVGVQCVPTSAQSLLPSLDSCTHGTFDNHSEKSSASTVCPQPVHAPEQLSTSAKIDVYELSEDSTRMAADEEKLFSAPFLLLTMVLVPAHSYSMHVVLDHLLLLLHEELGMLFDSATLYMSSYHFVGLFARLVFGPIIDHYNKWLLIFGFGAATTLSSLAIFDFSFIGITFTTSPSKIIAFVVLYAMGSSSVFSITTAMLPEFGREKLGMRSNFNLVMFFLFGSLGSCVAGVLKSRTGSYMWAFLSNSICFVIVSAVSACNYLCAKPSRRRENASNPVL